jgi:hypothetical protein
MFRSRHTLQIWTRPSQPIVRLMPSFEGLCVAIRCVLVPEVTVYEAGHLPAPCPTSNSGVYRLRVFMNRVARLP